MNTLHLLLIILAVIVIIYTIKTILKAIYPVKLRTYKMKNGNWYAVNVKSIKEAIKLAKEKYGYVIIKEDLEETDINIPKRFRSQILGYNTAQEVALKYHTKDKQ